MLALLSSPVRRWLLISLMVPALAFILMKLGLYLERRNEGQPTRPSRVLLSASSFLRRIVNKRRGEADAPEGAC